VLRNGLPFEARIPNKETREAIAETRAGGGKKHTGSTAAVLQDILEEDD
jgi:antitoxin component of RelBE/YafQ-DinJ toxin-antitoxin module